MSRIYTEDEPKMRWVIGRYKRTLQVLVECRPLVGEGVGHKWVDVPHVTEEDQDDEMV